MLKDLPRNARYTIMIEPMSAIFAGIVLFYAPLYMKGLGLTEVDIGIISTVGLLAGFIFQIFAAPVTNILGRKRTVLFFSMICWSIPLLIWAMARNFWYFLIAAVFFAVSKIVSVAWSCLVTEDVAEDKRPKVFGILGLISSISGVFTLAAGLLMGNFSIVPTMRVLYIVGFVSMTTMLLIRNGLITETSVGQELLKKHGGMSLWKNLANYSSIIPRIYRNKKFVLISLVYIIINFIIAMNFIQVIYIKEFLGFGIISISLVPAVGAVTNTFLFRFIIPKFTRGSENIMLTVSLIICAISTFLLLLIPKGNLTVLLVVTGVIGMGNYLVATYCSSVLFNKMGEDNKADMFSTVQIVTMFVCIPSGYIAGYAYSVNPMAPFVIMSFLFVLAIAVSFSLLGKNKKKLKNA